MTEEEKIYSKVWSFYLGNQCLWGNLFLEIFLVASKIEIHGMILVSDNIMSKVLKNFLWWSHFLIKTQGYSLQLRTILNSATDDFMAIFWNSCTKNFVKFPGTMCSLHLIENSKTPLQNCLFSNATDLLSRISGFKKTDSWKNVSCQCSEIAGNTLRKDL